MKVYIDIIFIVNYIYDFIILLSSSIILKRNTKLYRIIIGSLVGSLSMFILFIRFNNISLFLYKIIISILIILITYGYKNIRFFIRNIYYFYLISIIIAGLLFFVNNQFSSNIGLVFFNTYKLNIFIGILLSIIGIKKYINSLKEYHLNYKKYKNITIYFNNYSVNTNAFIDTGNKLKDPYLFRPIILLDKRLVKDEGKIIYVPYKTCNNEGLLRCIKANKIYIDGIGYRKNFLIGLTDNISIDGVSCLLNELLMEG